MIKQLFAQKRQYINHFFETVDLSAAENFFDILRSCQGLIALTGVGKSGLVAKKIAVTLTSTGTRAIYLSPTNALHGDIGLLSNKDVCIAISKSGESDELLSLVPTLKNRGTRLLSIVSNPNSRLAKHCDFSMTLPLEKELCPYNMVPTTSTSIQMIFGDVMAIALMKHQGFTLDQYALNHPAGTIGKRIILKVKDLMLTGKQIPICKPTDKLVDILVELSNKRCGCILVVDDHMSLQGIFTDGDLRRALLKQGPDSLGKPVQELMTRSPKWIDPSKLAWEAMQLMEADPKNAIAMLPVLDESGKVLGLIKLHDIIQSGL
ncbi:MAG: KpsF/GutQ family sugar-phosphate isomerase [Parachlamydiaceae bacterium]|nr:KpsF/GutQ family sugar-phosphate isomerase [Parachlamydiaceae bacterium]